MNKFSKDDLKKLGYTEVSQDVFEPGKRLVREVLGEPGPKQKTETKAPRKQKVVPGVYVFDLEPMGKPRMTRQDKWRNNPKHPDPKRRQRKCVTTYWAFKAEICRQAQAKGFVFPATGAYIQFKLSMPESWKTKKYRDTTKWNIMNFSPHQAKPDLDNMLKAVKDSLCKQDSFIHSYKVSKSWAEKGSITISFV